MKQYKVTAAVMVLDNETGKYNPVRIEVSKTPLYSPHEAIPDYLEALSNPFAHDIKIESVEV